MNDYKNKNSEWEKKINDDITLAAAVGVRGTPTIFINGKKTNVRTLEGYVRVIDEILKEKKN